MCHLPIAQASAVGNAAARRNGKAIPTHTPTEPGPACNPRHHSQAQPATHALGSHALGSHACGSHALASYALASHAADRPRCYTLNREWLFEQEAFHEAECVNWNRTEEPRQLEPHQVVVDCAVRANTEIAEISDG